MVAPQSKLRAMVDTNLLVAGMGWPRFPYEVLQHAVSGDYQLVLSSWIIQEARAAIAKVVPARKQAFEDFLSASEYEKVPSPTETAVQSNLDLVRDPKDVPVALAAINAQVDFLITQDKDFTDQDKTTEKLHQRLNIILPGTFLREHMGWTSEELEAIRHRNWDDLSPSSTS